MKISVKVKFYLKNFARNTSRNMKKYKVKSEK